MKTQKLSHWERLTVFIALIALAGTSFIYFNTEEFKRKFFNWNISQFEEEIGTLNKQTGVIKRKTPNGYEFITIQANTRLNNGDTIITGADSEGVVVLDDGSTIELFPNTMIRLSFNSEFAMSGIARSAVVHVVTGKVVGQSSNGNVVLKSKDKTIALGKTADKQDFVAKVPQAEPLAKRIEKLPPSETEKDNLFEEKQAIKVTLLSPDVGEQLAPVQKSGKAFRKVKFEWQMEPYLGDARLRIYPIESEESIILDKVVSPNTEGHGILEHTFTKPGVYGWSLEPTKYFQSFEPEPKSMFSVMSTFDGLEVDDPLVAGEKNSNNRFKKEVKKEFELQLKWKEVPGKKHYYVRVYKNKTDKSPIFEKKVTSNSYIMNNNKVFNGKIFYSVVAELPNGFNVKSALTPFSFDFNPPLLKLPTHKTSMAFKDRDKLIFTWEKTNFTKYYQFELSKDPEFNKEIFEHRTGDNFFFKKGLKPGTYYWHVRSVSEELKSPYSSSYELIIEE